MKASHHDRGGEAGFVLVTTLSLLALLVIVTMGVVASARLALQMAETSGNRALARQNALLGLGIALGALQRHASSADIATGMAGIAGVPAGTAGAMCRHWCAVWDRTSAPPIWLVSGAARAGAPQLEFGMAPIILVGPNTVGSEAANSEFVMAGRVSLPIGRNSGLAWWVGDEGVKISAAPSAPRVPALLPPGSPAASNTLRNALSTHAAGLARILTFEQLRHLPSPAAPLALSVIRDNFHSATLTASFLDTGSSPGAAQINLNTTNTAAWRAILEAFSSVRDVPQLTAARISSCASKIAGNFARASGGQAFQSIDALASSGLLDEAFEGTDIDTADFVDAMRTCLATRSDTFRVRSYGDAGGSMAHCEAIVQRSAIPPHRSSRYVIAHFRWLGPDDI